MAPSWSELPSDLLGVLLLHLRCLADRVYFGAVCRSWRSATAHAALPPQLPWLLLVPSAGAPCFVSLLAGSARRRISLPHGAQGARLCGAHAGGWLAVAASGWRACALVNAFSRSWVPLPDRMLVPRHGITTCLVVRAVALSAPPTSRSCVAAALVCGVSNLAFLRPGTDRQWLASDDVPGLQDVLYHDGEVLRGFHAVINDEAVKVFLPEGVHSAPDLMMTWRSYRMQRQQNAPAPSRSPSAGVSRYLVESRGKLLMVVRRFPSVKHGGGAAAARGFEVLELGVQTLPGGDHAAWWVELDGGLDGRVIFLSRGCSRAFEASQFAGFQEGIYFLEDTSFDISLALSRGGNFPCSDVGCYSGSEIMPGIKGFPSEFQSTISSPTWFYP
ncbi:uncharacterized protein LOC120671930 [Panicum virgatum]|uniref:KIB1-4 beta-propeller domain-containing protein n=1 Tax=Panicum virgatum TaxID=38727 RepID=A0A8T0RW03_PANVG|nr:uncharacterized protein LOC120671930 [Panicum virgatum]KAG2590591.1 hypothetical protein PVAP13_5NG416900 [Panicum virgatum]